MKLSRPDSNRTLRVSDMQEGFFIITENQKEEIFGRTKWVKSHIAITREEIEKLERATRPGGVK